MEEDASEDVSEDTGLQLGANVSEDTGLQLYAEEHSNHSAESAHGAHGLHSYCCCFLNFAIIATRRLSIFLA